MDEIIINPEYHALVPKPSAEDEKSMEESIKKDGLFLPIIVSRDDVTGKYVVLDGHTRFLILKELRTKVEIEVRTFNNKIEEKLFVIKVNRAKRNLTKHQKIMLARKQIELEKQLPKQRRELTFPQKGQKGFQKVSLPNGNNTGRLEERIFRITGIPQRTVSRHLFVEKNGSKEIVEKVEKGKMKASVAERLIKLEKSPRIDKPLPPGKYRFILADPPQKYYNELSGAPDYLTHATEVIINLQDKDSRPITDLFDEDAIIYLCCPIPKLEDGLEILKGWGFRYVTALIWEKELEGKTQKGTGYYIVATCELVLLGVKGKMGPPHPKRRPLGIIKAPRTKKHSEKPEAMRQLMREMYPNEKYLELFARKTAPDFVGWGNQLFDDKEPTASTTMKPAQSTSKERKLDDF